MSTAFLSGVPLRCPLLAALKARRKLFSLLETNPHTTTSMRTTFKLSLLLAAVLAVQSAAHAQGTAFTYNGRLSDNGAAANANYDMTFNLYDAENGGKLIAGPLPLTPVPIVNGLFAV